MSALRVVVLLALLAAPGWAQVLSEQQLDYLREQFLQNLTESVPGTVVEIGSLPANRIFGTLPANKITEADPIASAAAASAAASAASAQAAAAAAQGDADNQAAAISAVESRVSALEADAPAWDAAKARVDAIDAGFPAPMTLSFPMVGTTVTLYFAVGGVLTNAVQEGP